MAVALNRAQTNRALYIVGIDDTELERWLLAAGIQIGDPVWKYSVAHAFRPVWIAGIWGECIISPKIASNMLVEQPTGHLCTLDRLPKGKDARFVAHRPRSGSRLFLDAARIETGALLHLKQKLYHFDFLVEAGRETIRLDEDIAYHIWTQTEGKWTQLGARITGEPFKTIFFTGESPLSAGFDLRKLQQGAVMTIKKIIPKTFETNDSVAFIIKNEAGHEMTLKRNAIEKIKVRLCEICWSCGECEY